MLAAATGTPVPKKSNGICIEVQKRDGRVVPFDEGRIYNAAFKAFLADGGEEKYARQIARDIAWQVGTMATSSLRTKPWSVEEIQDCVEHELMTRGLYTTAKKYILYRSERAKARDVAPIPEEVRERVARNQQYFQSHIQELQFYDKYSRFREELGRRETWEECIDRSLSFLRDNYQWNGPVPEPLSDEEWEEIRTAMLKMEALPSMRLMQMAGPALERCHIGIYNCSYSPIDDLDAYAEFLYILMQGTGAGYSVEGDFIDRLPRVKKQKSVKSVPIFVVPDSTEGWCDALKEGLRAWFSGGDVEFDYSLIRPKGTRLKTKGGYSAGPEPLRELMMFLRKKILGAQGRHLSSLECNDISCKVAEIVQVGGVRRAATISLSDLDDEEMRRAKSGQFYLTHPYRSMANNSAVYNEKPSAIEFMREWLELAMSGSGERGIFNRGALKRQIPKRRKFHKGMGVNPCGEIILQPRGLCNLSMAIARPTDSRKSLMEKIRIATIIGTVQSMFTKFNYVRDDWKKNAEEERLLGVDITGQFDCPLLQPGAEGREELLESLRDFAVGVNEAMAQRFGINKAAAVTCIKPSGNSSQLVDCSSGLHPRYAPFYIRRVRINSYTPVASLLKAQGVPHSPEVGQTMESASVLVFDFPVKAPEGAFCRAHLTALEQLEHWLVLKTHYTEHNPSCTIQVRDDEWLDVGHWVYTHWDQVGGLSFLPYTNGVYQLAPYEEISEGEYHTLASTFPQVDWSELMRYEKVDTTERSLDYACVGGSCSLEQ